MTTTASYTTDWQREPSSRRCSTETIYSVQDIETDIARDTSDTEPYVTDSEGVEYEPVTDSEQEAPIYDQTSTSGDDDIIKTKVIAVTVGDDRDLQLADSEFTDANESATECRRHDFLRCAQCKSRNTNPIYRYCCKCFTMRKNFFPPRPRRNRKKCKGKALVTKLIKSQGTDDAVSQSSGYGGSSQASDLTDIAPSQEFGTRESPSRFPGNRLKRRAESFDHDAQKKSRYDSGTETDIDEPVQLHKTASEPVNLTKKSIASTVLEKMESKDLCVVCASEPKSGVFVHGRVAHICCCYRCAVKVWTTARRCPVCNCRVSNVLRAVVM